jgi:hypothetical protein
MLEERLDFLLSPLVPIEADPLLSRLYADHLHHHHPFQGNYDDLVELSVDWPRWLYREGHGAGMTIAQVSHALYAMPREMLTPPRVIYGRYHSSGVEVHSATDPTLLAFLYEQTPTVVMDMTVKQLDPRLTGVTNLGCAAVAYLHWKGWEWKTCLIVMDALHCFSDLAIDPGWDPSARRPGKQASLEYLRARLQLHPWQVRAIVRTHPNLAGYSRGLLESSIEHTLADLLGLTSSEIQRAVLRMPSMLGMSRQGLMERIRFWTGVGLTIEQVRGIALGTSTQKGSKHRQLNPNLLVYGMGNLHSKLDFFQRTLQINREDLIRLTISHPDLWGRSLDRHYLPLVDQFCGRLNLTAAEFGQSIASRAPHILKCHWDGSLSVKMDFLQFRLGLLDKELRKIVTVAPMILLSSTHALESKLELLSNAASTLSTVKKVIVNNPSLLQTTKVVLEKRLNRLHYRDAESLLFQLGLKTDSRDSARSRNVTVRVRRSRPVLLLSYDDERESSPAVRMTFSGVHEAADYAGTSPSTMYRILRERRMLNDNTQYVYAGTSLAVEESLSLGGLLNESFLLEGSWDDEIEVPGFKGNNSCESKSSTSLVIYATGRAFPATRAVRGHRRGGGMALYAQSWSSTEWKSVAVRVWNGQEERIRLLKNGCLILGYPYTRPSQRRCSLYVVREALRVALELAKVMPSTYDEVVVVTDSHYVVDLLGNSSKVMEWGEAETATAFRYDGPLKRYQANLDILYPLARTCFHLMSMNNAVTFALTSDYPEVPFRTLADGARLAARHMFELA